MRIVVRELTAGDLALLLDVPPDVFDHPIVPGSAEAFLARDGHHLVAAIDEGSEGGDHAAVRRVVGFVSAVELLHPDQARPELFINEVGVAEAFRRRGIGTRLIEETLRLARGIGCRGAWLAVDEENEAALGLYRGAGGTPPERQIHIDFGYGDATGTDAP